MFNFILHSAIDFEELKKADVCLNAILFDDLSGRHSPFFSFTRDSYKEYEKYLGSRHPEREKFFQYDIYKGLRENLARESYITTVRFYFLCVMACFVGEGFALYPLAYKDSWKVFEQAFTVLSKKCDFPKAGVFLDDWKNFWLGFEVMFGDKYGCCSLNEYSLSTFREFKVGLCDYLFSNGYFVEILKNKMKVVDLVKYYANLEIDRLSQIIEKNPIANLTNELINERNVLQDLLEYSPRKPLPIAIQ